MRRSVRVLAALLVVALAAGCGAKNLILRVDLLSFLAPEERATHYGPLLPGIVDSVDVVQSRRLNLLPGLEDVAEVTGVELELGAIVDNLTGTATGRIAIYLSPGDTDPFTVDTTPIVLPFAVSGAMADTLATVVTDDPELAALFTAKEAQIGIRMVVAADALGGPVEGDLTLTRIQATVTAREAVFE